jgi:DNA (cytosine-5)-methyltransferase 1
MEIRVFTAFSGYDSQCMALDRLHQHNPDFTYELVGWAEIDKYAIQAHNAVYPQWAERNYGDISKIDWAQVPDFDLFTYSSPCQDFSQAGKQAGGTEGSGTRSSLLWECRRAILAKRPKYLLMENVAALVSQKFIRLFNAWQLELESYGYRNFAKVLNAKDYGVPQNRERIFMVSVLDETARYEFPEPMPLTIRLKDVLEKEVEERYYLKADALEGFMPNEKVGDGAVNVVGELQADNRWAGKTIRQQNFVIGTDKCSMSITAKHLSHEFKIADPIVLGWSRSQEGKGEVISRHPVKVANCVTAGKRDNTQNYVLIPEATKDGYIPMEFGGVCDLSYPNSDTRRGRVQDGGTVAPTLTCGVENSLRRIEYGYRIRKLTERECFRLMDMPEEYIDRIQAAGISRSQQYKMAGNSIVVACMYHIWRKLFIDTEIKTLTLF